MISGNDDLLDELHIIDRRCDDFEEAWKSPEKPQPNLADYLGDCPESLTSRLLESLLTIELWWRMKAGESPKRDDYRDLLPDFDGLLDSVFNQQQEQFATALSRMGSLQTLGVVMDRAGRDSEDSWPTIYLRVEDSSTGKLRYQLISVIGRGQFGVMFLAYDHTLRRKVAIKVLSADVVLRMGSVDRCLHEARTLSQLRHPNVVPVYDAGATAEDVVYIVFAYVDGDNLSDLLAIQDYAIEDSVRSVLKLADALEEAHQRGIIHRDLKPANVIVERESREVFLVDFGLALVADQVMDDLGFFGTPAYMSPEQASGEKVTSLSDQYSLAVILYEMITGKIPFCGTNVKTTIDCILHQSPASLRSLNPEVCPELDQVCLRALSKDPGDRYPSIKQFAAALRQSLNLKAEAIPDVGRRRLMLGATVSGLVGLVGASVYYGWLKPMSRVSEQNGEVFGGGRIEQLGQCTLLANRQRGAFFPVDSMCPLQVGDSVRFDIQLDDPAFIKIIWVSGTGESSQIFPGQDVSSDLDSGTISVLQSPPDIDSGWPLQGASGLESAWVFVNRGSPIEISANDLQLPQRKLNEDAYFRSLTYSVDDGVAIHFGELGSGTRSVGEQAVASNDLLRRYLEELKDRVDAVWVFDLPYEGE